MWTVINKLGCMQFLRHLIDAVAGRYKYDFIKKKEEDTVYVSELMKQR